MKPLTIGQVAQQAGVGVETVRFYERQGLLEEPARRESGYRQYPEDVIVRLRFIKGAKELGFSLKEIKEFAGAQGRSQNNLPASQGTGTGEDCRQAMPGRQSGKGGRARRGTTAGPRQSSRR